MRVLLMLALVGAAFAAVPRTEKRMPQRIVGGSATRIEEYPYMSNMQYWRLQTVWTQWCGGSLITSRSILSAAHCYRNSRAFEWRVRLGSTMAASGGSLHDVSELLPHGSYNAVTSNNDIAIVRLASAAVLNGVTVAVIQIAGPTYNVPDGATVYYAGWGALGPGPSAGSPAELHHVDINIINQELCRQRYGALHGYPDITDVMFCAGILDVGGKDACQGDSGGPVIHKTANGHVAYGVTSWGLSCAHATYPGVNTRVSRFTDWVVANA